MRPGSKHLAGITAPDEAVPDCGFAAEYIDYPEGELMFWGLPSLVDLGGCVEIPPDPDPGTGTGCKPCETEHCITISWSAGTRACITVSTVECDLCPCRCPRTQTGVQTCGCAGGSADEHE